MVQWILGIVWGPWLTVLFLAAGIYFTVRFRGFQITGCFLWWRETAGSLLKGGNKEKKGQFVSACTALAATVGTGNIAGVAAAVAVGGPGAVFWMWASAVLGMMTAYAEVYLGRKYRYKDKNGRPVCGPYAYLEKGLGMRWMGLLYAAFCVLASLGMGSMVQANAVAQSADFSASIPLPVTGAVLTVLVMAVIFGGAGRISAAAVSLVPVSAGFYMGLCAVILLFHAKELPGAFLLIVKDAFSAESAAGGAAGVLTGRAVRYGISRGVFSNEAGLGSLAVLHGEAEAPEEFERSGNPFAREQGMWAVFEVFFDTIVSCTMTALVLLCVGGSRTPADVGQGEAMAGSAWVASCFSSCFGELGGGLVSLAMSLFAFATIIAWFYLGSQALSYLTEGKPWKKSVQLCYGFFYLNAVFFGCVARLTLVWDLSDIFNGLMAVPNLIGLFLLRRQVEKPWEGKR